MDIEIFYFSGTGNSLYVAKQLQMQLENSEIRPIVGLLNNPNLKTKGKIIGIIFPVHALSVPIVVRQFLRKIDFGSAEYIFAVATRLGIVFSRFSQIDNILKKKNKKLNAQILINMDSNDSKSLNYKTPTPIEINNIQAKVDEQIEFIKNIIINNTDYKKSDDSYLINHPYNRFGNYGLEKTVTSLLSLSELTGGVNYYYSDNKCTNCGICEKVCLSGKIKIMDKKPLWQKEVLCFMCYACVNFCPVQAVQIKDIPGVKSYTHKNGRYTHPYAKVKDIESQKIISK